VPVTVWAITPGRQLVPRRKLNESVVGIFMVLLSSG